MSDLISSLYRIWDRIWRSCDRASW